MAAEARRIWRKEGMMFERTNSCEDKHGPGSSLYVLVSKRE